MTGERDGQDATIAAARARRQNAFLLLLVFTVGMSTLGAEIAAARLLAPYWGASTVVWANTIGIVLVALAGGYAVGGRIGDRYPSLRALSGLALGASVLVMLIPFVGRPFFSVAAEALDTVSTGAFLGSLVGVLAMVAVPIMLLGAVSPWAIRLAIPDVDHSGRTAGRLYAVSTTGSLAGTMLSALVLIPFLGTQRTFVLFALLIALVSCVQLPRRFLVVPAVIAMAMAVPVGTLKEADNGTVLLERETEHQYVRVLERPSGDRLLELNEGQAIHSKTPADWSCGQPKCYLTNGVWDWYLVLPQAALGRTPERMAILGNGTGTTARAYGHYFPETEIHGVEIDGELAEIGREWFDMRNDRLTTYAEDARPYLRRSDGGYDTILVDAYRQPYIPFYLTTVEFFELARERLEPGGVVIVNAGQPAGQVELETTLARTMSEVFPEIRRAPMERTNTLLLGSEDEISPSALRRAARDMPEDLRPLAEEAAGALEPRLEGGSVFTDDRAPVEWLIDRSLAGYAADQED